MFHLARRQTRKGDAPCHWPRGKDGAAEAAEQGAPLDRVGRSARLARQDRGLEKPPRGSMPSTVPAVRLREILLMHIVTFHEVTADTELANTEPLLPEETQG